MVALLVTGFVLLQAAWFLTLPPFRGIDEFDHAFRAAGVAGGQVVATEPVVDGRGLLVAVPPDLVAAAHEQCAKLGYTGPDNCSAVRTISGGRVLVGSGAAGYYPPFYWLIGTVAKPFEGSASLMAMRLTASILCAAFVGLAGWAASRRATSWVVAGVVAAISPTLAYSTVIAAPNGLEMAAGLALWVTLLSALSEADDVSTRRLLWAAIVSAAVMCSVRPLAPFFVLLIVVTVAVFGGRRSVDIVRRHRSTVLAGAVIVAICAAGLMVWTRATAVAAEPGAATDGNGLQPIHGAVWMVQAVAAFPYRNQFAPGAVYVLVGSGVIGLFLALRRYGAVRSKTVVMASLVVALALPFMATVVAGDSRQGVIWQGRYGLPYSVGFLIMLGYAVAGPVRGQLSPVVQTARDKAGRSAAVVVSALYAAATAISLIDMRHRELTDNPASAGDASWHAPSIWLIVTLTATAYITMMAAAHLASDQSRPKEKADSRS